MNIISRLKRITLGVCLGSFAWPASGATPSTQPMPPLIGAMRPATLDARTYLCIEMTCTINTLIDQVMSAFTTLESLHRDQEIVYTSGAIIRFPRGMDFTGGHFTVQVGYCVEGDTTAPSSARVIQLRPYRCATLNYTGPMPHLKDAYDAIETAVKQAGLKPTGEVRESYLYWENYTSDNDVTQLQFGVE